VIVTLSGFLKRQLSFMDDEKDLLILFRSSGNSGNVLNAAKKASELNIGVITFFWFK